MRGARLAALLALALPAAAAADHSLTDRISTGTGGGNAEEGASFRGASQDGTRVFFETAESLLGADTDGLPDVYERAGTATTLISTGPNGPNGSYAASFARASADGMRVFFSTKDPLVPADTDTSTDVYERSGGATSLISAGGNGSFNALFDGMSSDGTRVFFHTSEKLLGADTDNVADVYERFGANTTLVSAGEPGRGNTAIPALFKGASGSGTRVFFESAESLVSGDSDTTTDVYERSAGTTSRLSFGPAGGNGGIEEFFDAFFAGASADGTRVIIETDEVLTGDDADVYTDVYERSGGAITRVSTGPLGGNDDFPADFRGSSVDGTHVFFQTSEPLAGDADIYSDVYERHASTTTLVSTGPLDDGGQFDASFAGASQDGTRVFFATALSLVAADLDGGWRDTYERAGGATKLISTGPADTGGAFNAFFHGASVDGSRVFFQTDQALVSADTDSQTDVYERFGDTTTSLSIGPQGGNDPLLGASFAGGSQDGRHVFVHTGEALLSGDADGSLDVYHAVPNLPYPRPVGAAKVRVTLVPAFVQCTSANTSHGPPLNRAACNPATLASGYLTVLNNDATRASGSLTLRVFCTNGETPPCASAGEQEDARLIVNVADVRTKADGSDYSGELEARLGLRITDRFNGFGGENATVGDAQLSGAVPCTSNTDPTLGSSCSLNTTVNSLVPGTVRENARSIWQLAGITVYDGGPDGVAATSGNTLFLRQAIFVP